MACAADINLLSRILLEPLIITQFVKKSLVFNVTYKVTVSIMRFPGLHTKLVECSPHFRTLSLDGPFEGYRPVYAYLCQAAFSFKFSDEDFVNLCVSFPLHLQPISSSML